MRKSKGKKEDRVTLRDILNALQSFSLDVEKRFEGIEKRLGHLENVMVTKEYLDAKLADLASELRGDFRDEDVKFKVLVDILHDHDVISEAEVKQIYALPPFRLK